ncbi:uncharacterized protein Z519_06158 [Cladophialophora bantiana CBS 173.52]|uniref:Carbohydrate kinase PfkB domain-containing protein n=1 Tax=Cladophialophora bantiana (strain ATCC 10958 / CBS 173.52 / CDC B-1940 / NIH 8579) TaxID=1442370 RepID=A0A0D2HJW5_CLAB1|nr:uncharacterized protein Z519_06158 [Cladophialophora bantiana CBS 173.52]KIW93553.1 hypothetical protein Z519_06158 [Cladophialophora bantiana CBS 173.52]
MAQLDNGGNPPNRLAFCTLGMFIIDKIEYLSNTQAPQDRIIGGAGTYAALGARLAAGSRHAASVGWIVDMGSDFPGEFKSLIEAWRTSCVLRFDGTRLTTTAWNGYGDNEYRAFKYLTPKLRLNQDSLSDDQLLARSFHMVCSPSRCISLVRGILDRRRRLLQHTARDSAGGRAAAEADRPVFVWEPIPDLCTPDELSRLREAAGYVDVVSPNADEFESFFREMPGYSSRELMVENLLGLASRNGEQKLPLRTALVVREGAQGCTTYVGSTKGLHLRAYHQSREKVVDPTGGGNTFLGALAIGMTGITTPGEGILKDLDVLKESVFCDKRLLLGLVHATIAAGYAIEQIGMPRVSTEDGDCWNGEAYRERFRKYIKREREHIIVQL